jgi:molybdopterin-guanine dinucleotide biosynthesis protein A
MESLMAYLQSGQRKIDRWTALHRCVTVEFEDSAAFVNANTLAELQQLQHGRV